MGVERFEVEVFDPLKKRSVKRPIPDYETLELADPREAVRAERVTIRGSDEPKHVFMLFAGRFEDLGGFLTGKELEAFTSMPGVHYEDPRYLYVLLHALGLRKLAFLLLGTKPLDEEEEALRDVAVVDVPPLRGRYRMSPWRRPVRAVFLIALPDPYDIPEEEWGGDPLVRGVLHLEMELKALGQVTELAALASGEYVPFPPYSPFFYVRARWLAQALRWRESSREALAQAGVQLGELSMPQPWSKVLEREGSRKRGLVPFPRPLMPEEAAALEWMSELRRAADLCLSAHEIPDARSVLPTSYIILGLFNALSMRDTVLVETL
jgi:hypothetical protein